MAPTIYITGNPSRTDAGTRDVRPALGQLTARQPVHGPDGDLSVALADPVGMKALHMVTADPQRTPTLTMFAAAGLVPVRRPRRTATRRASPCRRRRRRPRSRGTTAASSRRSRRPGSGWSGRACAHLGDDDTWADHTDIRPTMLSCSVSATRTSTTAACSSTSSLPGRCRRRCARTATTLRRLGEVYKQLNAPFRQFRQDMLAASTKAIKSGSSTDDSTYTQTRTQMPARRRSATRSRRRSRERSMRPRSAARR